MCVSYLIVYWYDSRNYVFDVYMYILKMKICGRSIVFDEVNCSVYYCAEEVVNNVERWFFHYHNSIMSVKNFFFYITSIEQSLLSFFLLLNCLGNT